MHQPDYSEAELMAVLLSREVRDREVAACGALSQIPAAGLLLAKERHAPNADLIILNSVFSPFHTSRQFHYLAQRGELGLFFISGVQIDQYGNCNLHMLGDDPDHPDVRFPGGYGGGMIYYGARRTVVFRTEHTRRCLVPRVDFVSAAGSSPPDVLRHGHPSKIVTTKAIFRFDVRKGLLRLDTIHAPYTLEHIREHTGFDLRMAGRVAETPPPTREELRILRQAVRQKMIDTGTYPDWAQKQLGGGDALSA